MIDIRADEFLKTCSAIVFLGGRDKEEGSRFRHFGGFELDFTMFRY